MTSDKQVQMAMRDMLFITWAVQPETARKLVDERMELDTLPGPDGRPAAFVSAVSFHVTEVSSGLLPLQRLSFEQLNYRVYVRAGEAPAVYFLDMKVNSRMVTAMTSFLSIPVHYEDIEITTAPRGPGLLSYSVKSTGLRAEAVVGEQSEPAEGEQIAPDFITHRLVGYAASGNGMFRIDVTQPGLVTVPARIRNVEAPSLERLGLLTRDQSTQPYSVLYVREGQFGADTPVREW